MGSERAHAYTLQWNLNVQRELPWSLLLDVAYAGNHGVKLTRGREMNALDPQYLELGNALTATQPNPFPLGAAAAANVTQRQLLLPSSNRLTGNPRSCINPT